MNDSDEISCISPQLREAAKCLGKDSLPKKSRAKYDRIYDVFKSWCSHKSVKKVISENVVLAYFCEIAKIKKVSTLWSTYSILRITFHVKDKINISKFPKLLAFLK